MANPKKNQILQFMTPFVDKTDFASVESGVTSGFTQRLWGVKHGVSTATVAKTPSKTLSVVRSGVFRVTLKSTEVSDFDQVFWQGTHASCADQLWSFNLVDNDDSDVMSTLTVIQSMASDAHSAAAQANSRVLLIQSRLSDLDSRLVSDLSDVLSAVNVGNSRVLLNQSRISDTYSMLSDMYSDFQSRVPKRVATDSQLSDVHSDLRSLIGGITATISASDISDIVSAVDATLASRLSDILSAAQQANSRILINQSRISDTYSMLSDMQSDLLSLLTTTGVQLNASTMSDLRSAINGITVSITASDISDIASAVDATLASRLSDILSAAQQTNSRVLVVQSLTSDVYSSLSDVHSDLLSLLTTTGVQLNASTMSDLRSAINGVTATLSVSDISDIASAVDAALASRLSDILSAAQQGNSRVLVVQSMASDVYSLLSDTDSDLRSLLTTTGVQLNASTMSDLRSAIADGGLSASNISDIASAVYATVISNLSDILSAAQQTNSRVLVNQSRISDTYSMLSDMYSDFQSRVPKRVATDSQLSNVHSDIISNLANISVTLTASDISDIASAVIANLPGLNASDISDIASAVDVILSSRLSDILSAAQQGNSRVLVVQSMTSDVYSLLSDANSDLRSLMTTTGVQLNASTMSDIRSAIADGGITASGISDIASAVYAALVSNLSDILSAAQQGNSRILLTQSMTSDVYSMLSNLNSDLLSLLTTTGVQLNASTMSDLRSAIVDGGVTASSISDIASAVRAILVSDLSDILSAAQQANSRALVIQSQTSDIYSLLSDVSSDLGVMSGVLSDAYSGLQQVNSRVLVNQSQVSDIYSLLSGLESDIQSRFPATIPELTTDPGATPTWAQAEAMQFMWLKNNTKSTSTKRFLRNNAGTTVLSATIGDDGTSFVQGKLA